MRNYLLIGTVSIGLIASSVLLLSGCLYTFNKNIPEVKSEPTVVESAEPPKTHRIEISGGGAYTREKEEEYERKRLHEQQARAVREPSRPTSVYAPAPVPAPVPEIKVVEVLTEIDKTDHKQVLTNRILDYMTEQGQSLIFDVPKTVKFEQVFQAVMKIDPTKTEQELVKEAKHENPTVKSVRVSSIVRAEIKVDEENFRVKNLTASEQGLVADEATTWAWELTALKPGQHSINLVVTGVVELDGKRVERSIRYERTEIVTNITVLEKIEKWFETLDYKWIAGLILGGILVPLILAYLKKKYDLGK